MNNDENLNRYNSMTPVYPDSFYMYYEDAVNTNANVLSGMDDTMLNQNILPRGCFPVQFAVTHNITGGGQDDSLISTDPADTFSIVVTVTVTEPLFLRRRSGSKSQNLQRIPRFHHFIKENSKISCGFVTIFTMFTTYNPNERTSKHQWR